MNSESPSFVPEGPRRLVQRRAGPAAPRYSLCAMVTRWEQYDACIATFRAGGFDERDCEFLVIDNSRANRADAYVGINELLQAARGDHIILHHQDVFLREDGRIALDARLAALSIRDPRWAVCGNAGHTFDNWPVACLSHPFKERHVEGGPFPVRVVSLDENFLVVRRLANLAVSADLEGFHHYGVDLCTIADVLGWHAYVIDFFLRHDSGGTFDESYERSLLAIQAKYRRAFRSRWAFLITKRRVGLSGSNLWHRARPGLRRLGELVGVIPRAHHLHDLARRAKRDARVGPGH